MMKLKKFYKPFLASMLAAVVLLFGQAMCDLKLPDTMSDIINVGIQQGGIEHASPDVISEKAMDLMSLFMDEKEKDEIFAAYDSVESGSDASLISQYAKAEEMNVYRLNDQGKHDREALDVIFGNSAWTFINVVKEMAAQSQMSGVANSASDFSAANLDFDQIYSMLPMLQALPEELINEQHEIASALSDSTKSQTGSVFVKLFYEELGADTQQLQFMYILKKGGMMLLITLLGAIATIAVGLLASRIAAGLGRDLRKAIFEKVESFSNAEFDKYSTSSLITRTTNDITQVQTLIVMGIRMIFYAPIMGIGGIIMISSKNLSMVWILALAVAVLLCLIAFIFVVAMPKFSIMQKLLDKLNLVSRENLTGQLVIRAFGSQKFEKERFDEANKDLTKNSLFVQRVMAMMMPCMNIIMNFTTLMIVWVGAHQIAASNMQVGDMMAFMQYGIQIIMSFLMISMIFILIPRATVSANRIYEVLSTEPSINDPENEAAFDEKQIGVVEFDNVSFHYAGAEKDVLENVSFVARPGETTAFIGSTGSGKSTLINLIPRFYDVTGGCIKVNGADIRTISQHRLHEQVGYVPQKGVLLSGTIESNLRYGRPDATEDEIREAAEVAQATDFIEKKEDGFNSLIAQGGTNVSGGQKQRLSIARALTTKAPILIFDDSFSALDFKTDATLRAALYEHTSDATVLIVAQRVSTIMNADQILVLDHGKVVGKGTHEELLKSCPTYYEIASSQLSKEEL